MAHRSRWPAHPAARTTVTADHAPLRPVRAPRRRLRRTSLTALAGLLALSTGCKRTADAPLPRRALFPDVTHATPTPPEREMQRAELLRAVEPDGERAQARKIPANVVVAGELAGPKVTPEPSDPAKPAKPKRRKRRRFRALDDDWFQVDPPAEAVGEQVTRIELRDAPRCARLDVFAGGRRPIRSATWHRGVRPVLPGLRLDKGPLWVRVRCLVRVRALEGEPGTLGGPYRLAVSTRPRRIDEEREPNEKLSAETQVVMHAQTVQATLAPRGDVDVFRLDLSGAQAGTAQMLSVTGAPGVDLEVGLYADGRTEPLLVRRPRRGEGVLVPNLDVRRTGTSTTLRVRALRGQAPDAPYAATVRALLPTGCTDQLVCPEKVPVEREPNDHRAAAMGIKAGSLISGVLDGRGDEDWYAIDGTPGQVVQVRLRAPEGLAVSLSASHDGGAPWVQLQGKADGERVTLPGWRTTKRRVYVRVSGVDDAADATALYFLRVAFVDLPRFEPADGATAPLLSAREGRLERAGTLLPAGDSDTYTVDWSARTWPTKAELVCGGDGLPGLRCTLKDAAGQVLAEVKAPDEGAVRQEVAVPPGVVSLTVDASSPRVSQSHYVVALEDRGPVVPPAGAVTPTFAPVAPGIGAPLGGRPRQP